MEPPVTYSWRNFLGQFDAGFCVTKKDSSLSKSKHVISGIGIVLSCVFVESPWGGRETPKNGNSNNGYSFKK